MGLNIERKALDLALRDQLASWTLTRLAGQSKEKGAIVQEAQDYRYMSVTSYGHQGLCLARALGHTEYIPLIANGLSPAFFLPAHMAFNSSSQGITLGPFGPFCSPPPSSFNFLFKLNIFK